MSIKGHKSVIGTPYSASGIVLNMAGVTSEAMAPLKVKMQFSECVERRIRRCTRAVPHRVERSELTLHTRSGRPGGLAGHDDKALRFRLSDCSGERRKGAGRLCP